MAIDNFKKMLCQIGYNPNVVSKAMKEVDKRWGHKLNILDENLPSWINFFKEAYDNSNAREINYLSLYGKLNEFFALDGAEVSIQNVSNIKKIILKSGEKIVLGQKTIEGLEELLEKQKSQGCEIPGLISIKNYVNGTYFLEEIDTTKILYFNTDGLSEEESYTNASKLTNIFSSFNQKDYKKYSEKKILKYFKNYLEKSSLEKLYECLKYSDHKSIVDYLIEESNNFAISSPDFTSWNWWDKTHKNKVPIHTHPELKTKFKDNRYPSGEIVYLEEMDFVYTNGERLDRLPFQLITTTFKGKHILTAYSIDQDKDYYISIFNL